MWVVLTFLRGAFWRVHAFDDDIAKKESLERWPRVAAVVPARNEAEVIARTVESLAKQEYAGELRVAVVDDHSEGGNGTDAAEAASRGGGRDRGMVFDEAAAELEAARPHWRRWGERGKKHPVARFWWRLEAGARLWREAEVLASSLFFRRNLCPPSWTAGRRRKTAGAAGGCILLKRAALE